MSFETRKELYSEIEEKRNRPLVAYITSIRPNASASMASDAIQGIIKQVQIIPAERKDVDFLLVSNGGDPITSLRIISILRERFRRVSVLIPYVAYSAATVLSLGADEIIMHPFSSLGPVDPQITVESKNKPNTRINFSTEDLSSYIDFLKTDVGISDQEHLISAFNSLTAEIGPQEIGFSKRSQQLSLSLSQKMLEEHMTDKNKAKTIAKSLMSSYYHHGYAVSRKEAKKIGLPIVFPEKNLEELIWAVWEDFNQEMKCDKAFDPLQEILKKSEVYDKLMKIPVLNIPVDLPEELKQQVFQQIIQSFCCSYQTAETTSTFLAAIESLQKGLHVYQNFEILVWRDIQMKLLSNITTHSEGWKEL